MQQLGTTIRARRTELGLTLERLGEAVGCHKSYLSQIENGRRPEGAQPSEELLFKLERSLRLPAGRLVAAARWQGLHPEMREEVRHMEMDRRAGRRLAALLRERTLDRAHESGELAGLVEMLTRENGAEGDGARTGEDRAPETRGAPGSAGSRADARGVQERRRNIVVVPLPVQVPVINRVSAGYPTEFTDLGFPARVADDYVSVPEVHDPDAFAARVVGDSMAPEYREGDIVVFSPEREARSGDDCFVRFERDAETTFKRVFFEGATGTRHQASAPQDAGRRTQNAGPSTQDAGRGTQDDATCSIRLQPLNPRYGSRVLGREEVAGLYVAVWVIRAAPGAR